MLDKPCHGNNPPVSAEPRAAACAPGHPPPTTSTNASEIKPNIFMLFSPLVLDIRNRHHNRLCALYHYHSAFGCIAPWGVGMGIAPHPLAILARGGDDGGGSWRTE